MLKGAYLLAKIGADPAENEQHLAEILTTFRRDGMNQDGGAERPAGLAARAAL